MTDAAQYKIDANYFMGFSHHKFVLRMREMVKTDPGAYAKARAACTKSLTESMVRAPYYAIAFLLSEGTDFTMVEGRGVRAGECFFGQDEGVDIRPNYPGQLVAEIAQEISMKNAECMKAQIKMLFPTLEQVLEMERIEKLADERHEAAMERARVAKAAKAAAAEAAAAEAALGEAGP